MLKLYWTATSQGEDVPQTCPDDMTPNNPLLADKLRRLFRLQELSERNHPARLILRRINELQRALNSRWRLWWLDQYRKEQIGHLYEVLAALPAVPNETPPKQTFDKQHLVTFWHQPKPLFAWLDPTWRLLTKIFAQPLPSSILAPPAPTSRNKTVGTDGQTHVQVQGALEAESGLTATESGAGGQQHLDGTSPPAGAEGDRPPETAQSTADAASTEADETPPTSPRP